MHRPIVLAAALLLGVAPALAPAFPATAGPGPAPRPGAAVLPWGVKGHTMAARAALAGLPVEMPGFFRGAGDGLAYLDPEPDRWRNRALGAMDQAWSYDHYIDLENVPEGALDAPDRFAFLDTLYRSGEVEDPVGDVGFLPYRILELYQRLVTEWRLWREAGQDAPEDLRWIEMRIVNDAGILGHYVTDAAQPHHTTIHYNGWAAGAPNPEGFTYADDFHWRFESEFVNAHVEQIDVDRFATADRRSVAGQARSAIWAYIQEGHHQVERLYELEKEEGFAPGAPAPQELRDFTARRLAAGADMLRTLWWSAWLESAEPVDEG